MSDVRELPELVTEFVDMSKEYLRQETIVPAKQLGRFGGLALGAGVAFAIGAMLLSIGIMRYIQRALPEGPNWEALGYVLSALLLGLVAAVLIKLTSDRTSRRS
jgi:ABC-type branched-subunit amino acid transport system permease subunit